MAYVGLKYVVAAPINAEAATGVTYSAGFVVGKATTANISISTSNVKLYGDDAVAEMDNAFSEGTLDVGVTVMTDDIQTKILGHTKATGNDAEITASVDDVVPYCGVGFYAPKMDNHVRKYRAIWFTKTMGTEPSEDLQTKQGATAYVTPTIQFAIMADMTGAWKKEQTFDTEAAAKAWLDNLAGI